MSDLHLDLKAFRCGFTLEVAIESDGPWVGVVGPSGAGKSTLLDAVAGLVPSIGTVRIGSKVLQDTTHGISLPVRERRCGYVFQGEALFPHLTVAVNLAFGMRDRGQIAAQERFTEVVEVLDLGTLLDRRPPILSGGERQRVALARALLSEPVVLLFDEPLTGLDPALRERVLDYLARARARFAHPTLFVSHRLEDVLALSDHVVVLEQGRVAAAGDARTLLTGAHRSALSRLIGFENVFEVEVTGIDADAGTVREKSAGLFQVVLPPGRVSTGDRVRVGVRAEDVLLAAEHPGRTSARNLIPGTLVSLTPRGGLTLVEVDCGIPLVAKVTPAAVSDLGLAPGGKVWCLFKAHSCHYLEPGVEPAESLKVRAEEDI